MTEVEADGWFGGGPGQAASDILQLQTTISSHPSSKLAALYTCQDPQLIFMPLIGVAKLSLKGSISLLVDEALLSGARRMYDIQARSTLDELKPTSSCCYQ